MEVGNSIITGWQGCFPFPPQCAKAGSTKNPVPGKVRVTIEGLECKAQGRSQACIGGPEKALQ